MAVLCRFILFKTEPGTFRVRHEASHKRQNGINTIPFTSIKKIYYSNKSAPYKFKNIAGNVLGFIPLGFLLPFLVFRRWGIILSILSVAFISMGFEYIQLYTGCGVFDVDDIILNSLGGIIGALFYGICQLAHYLLFKKRDINTVRFTQLTPQ